MENNNKKTDEEMLEEEKELDELNLEHKIKVKDKIIRTFGEHYEKDLSFSVTYFR